MDAANERTIYRHQTATWMYRLLPLSAIIIPLMMGGGQVSVPVAITMAILAFAALIYAKIKLHGRVDEVRTSTGMPQLVRLRQPGLIGARWKNIDWSPKIETKLSATNIRNAASAYTMVITRPDQPEMRLPMNGASVDLDALAELSPKAIAEFRKATEHTRIHYDL
ncbi:MAG: hypothetical protein AAFO75_11690 [Pseudomonadota bacterium]